MDDLYRNPGPLQFEGPGADAKTYTLAIEDQDYMGRMKKLQEYLDKVHLMITFASLFSSKLKCSRQALFFVLTEVTLTCILTT